MQRTIEPKPNEFFASAAGVCVYVNARGRAVRIQFTSAGGPGVAEGKVDAGAAEALVVASSA